MKKMPALLSACAMLGSGATLAQGASVSIYGLVDVGVEHVTNVGAAGKALNRMPSATNTAPSRLGFRGTEDLGNGLTAFFTLEQGIVPSTGALGQGGRGFGRQALVGVSGPFGSIALGRQYTMTFWSGLNADIHGGGIYGTGSLDSYLPNARADNALSWRHTLASGLTLGATYSLGRDVVNAGPSPAGTNCPGQSSIDSKACREWSVMVKYDTPNWGVALANDRFHGRSVGEAPDTVFGGLDSSDKIDNRFVVNGWSKLGNVKLGGGLIRRSNDGSSTHPDSDLWHMGASMPVSSSLTLSAQAVTLRYKNASNFNATVYSLRATHELSKRSAVYGQIGHIKNGASSAVALSGGSPGSTPAVGSSQAGLNVGVRVSF
jgi:predicted porin